MLDNHPGGLKKLMQTNQASIGHTGSDYGFSFTQGKNAHFPGTGKTFNQKVKEFVIGDEVDGFLKPVECAFGDNGSVVILGRFRY